MRSMQRSVLVAVLVLASSVAAFAQGDAIDLHTITVHGSPRDIADWPITVHVTRVTMDPRGGLVLTFDQALPERWKFRPDPVNAPGDNWQFTVWIVALVDGVPHGAGFVQMWQGRTMGDRSLPPILGGYRDWWGDGRRLWGALSDYVPAAGDVVGLLVSAGNGRLVDGVSSVRERSNLITFPLPIGDAGDFHFTASTPPTPPAPPGPTIPPADTEALEALAARVAAIEARAGQLAAALGQLEARVDAAIAGQAAADLRTAELVDRVRALEARPTVAGCRAALNIGAARIPVACQVTP